MTRKPLRSRVTAAALLVTPAVVGLAAPGVAQGVDVSKEPASCEATVEAPKSNLLDGNVEEITSTVVVDCEGLAPGAKYKLVSKQREFVDTGARQEEPKGRPDIEEEFVRADQTGSFSARAEHKLTGPVEPKDPENVVGGKVTVFPALGNAKIASDTYRSEEFEAAKEPEARRVSDEFVSD